MGTELEPLSELKERRMMTIGTRPPGKRKILRAPGV
jgi:hypothetical protein